MINGITYYKLKSPYNGDVTKNCSVSGIEIDNNFFTLEGRDVKSITVDGTDIVLNLLNGEQLKAIDVLDNFITNISFDKENGILKAYHNNGDVEEFDGFVSIHEHNDHKHLDAVASNETLIGNGTNEKPLKLAEAYKTGQFKPVDKIVTDKKTEKPFVGERVLVSEERSAYGLLYNYSEVIQIACELNNTHSKWRIPSKADWDDMLNAIEPCKDNKNHDKSTPDRYFGKWAGKLLKSKYYWKDYEGCECDCKDDEDEEMDGCHCGKHRICKPTYCGEFDTCHFKAGKFNTQGIDKYGFTVLPSGYTDDGGIMNYFGERACFWTSTNMEYTNIFTKRFEYNSNKVYQGIVPAKCRMSLRLVKDYTGDNYTESENILGQNYPTVLMPSVKNGKAVWTSINVYYTSPSCKGCHCCCNGMNDNLDPIHNPNDILIKKYYIDEWNGFKWLRNEFKEGDSVVVKTAPDGKKDIEYRLVEGELTNIHTMVKNTVVDEITPIITDMENRLTEAINQEKTDRENADTELQNQITAEVQRATEKDAYLETTLGNFGKETAKAFETLNNALVTSVNNINTALQTEAETRAAADEDLQRKLDKDAQDLVNAVTEINEEIARLDGVDNEIKEEIARLDGVDNEIKEALAAETEERKAKDEELDGDLLDNTKTVFDAENGIIKLKSKDGSNDIDIQLTMNFGQF